MVVNVTITAFETAEDGDQEAHRCHFLVDDVDAEPRMAFVTLRTVRVLVRELPNLTGLDSMMRTLVAASPSEYESLIGARFAVARGPT